MTAFEDGDPKSKLLILGQAPAKDEIRANKPFVGPSGEVLQECLHAAGMSRRDCYVLNVWEQQVYTDKKGLIYEGRGGELLWPGKHESGFTERGWELAQGTLERIRNSGSNTIVPMGQQALALCTGHFKAIMKWRGSPLIGLDRVGMRYVVPTIHPAATIHGVYLWRHIIVSDLKKARKQSEAKASIAPTFDIKIRPTLEEVLNFMEHCKREKLVASDLEVINHQVSCFSLNTTIREAVVCAFTDEQGDVWDEDAECQIWKAYADLMADPSVMKVNQNIVGFDAPFLMMQNNIIVRGEIGDPMIAQSILYPEFRKGLDFIASIHTDNVYWKDEGKMWKNEGGDFPQFWRYNGKDSCVALEAWYKLAQELTDFDMWHTYNSTVDMLPVLMFATMDGLEVDAEGLAKTKADIEQQLDGKIRELETTADYPFNPNSTKQCQTYFYDHKRLTPYRNGNGGLTTDDKAMSRIFRKTQLPEAKLVQECRSLRKLKGTYLEVEFDADGRLRCTWNARGTWTGRLSSSQTIFGRGMNLQNLDPRFKGFIVEDKSDVEIG